MDARRRDIIGQSWLIEMAHEVGYKDLDFKGACYGIAYMAIQALLSNDIKTFKRRNEILHKVSKNQNIQQVLKEATVKYKTLLSASQIEAFNEITANNKNKLLVELMGRQPKKGDLMLDILYKNLTLANWPGETRNQALKEIDALSAATKLKMNEKMQGMAEDQKIILELSGFFFGINAHHFGFKHPEWFEKGKAPGLQDFTITSSIVLPTDLQKAIDKKNLQKDAKDTFDISVDSFSGINHRKDMEAYFSSLQAKIEEKLTKDPEYFKHPITFAQTSGEHTIAVAYDPSLHKWQFIDPNQLLVDYTTDLKDIAERVHVAFSLTALKQVDIPADYSVAYITDVFAHPDEEEKVKDLVASWRQDPAMVNMHDTKAKAKWLDEDGIPWLFLAMQTQELDIFKSLLKNGTDPNQAFNTNSPGTTVLLAAAESGYAKVVELLLQHAEIDPNKAFADDGRSPLFVAAEAGHIEVVNLLLKHPKIDLNLADSNGVTPLAIAAAKGQLEIAESLLAAHANPQQASLDNNELPLHAAAKSGNIKMLELFLDPSNINQAAKDGSTPLYLAAANNHLDMVSFLLNKGADPNSVVLPSKLTALTVAAKNGQIGLLDILLSHEQINPNIPTQKGSTPLIIATQEKQVEVITRLLGNNKVDPYYQNNEGETALSIAIKKGDIKVLDALLAGKIDLNRPCNKDNDLPLDLAMKYDQAEIIQRLVTQGANPNHTKTSLAYYAAEQNNPKLLELSIAKMTDPNISSNGSSPLHVSVEKGNLESVKILLSHQNIQVNKLNKNGESPLHIAIRIGNEDMVKTLLSNKADAKLPLKKQSPLELAKDQKNIYNLLKQSLPKKSIFPFFDKKEGIDIKAGTKEKSSKKMPGHRS